MSAEIIPFPTVAELCDKVVESIGNAGKASHIDELRWNGQAKQITDVLKACKPDYPPSDPEL